MILLWDWAWCPDVSPQCPLQCKLTFWLRIAHVFSCEIKQCVVIHSTLLNSVASCIFSKWDIVLPVSIQEAVCLVLAGVCGCVHHQFPYVVTVLWQGSDYVVTVLLSTCVTSGRLQNRVSVPPWFLHSDLCYWVPSRCPSVTVQLPTTYSVARLLHGPHCRRYPVLLVCHVITVQIVTAPGLDKSDYIVTVVVTV